MFWMMVGGSPVGQGVPAAPVVPADPSDEEDRAWVLQFRDGGEEGFNRLVLKHKDRIYSLCARMLGDPDEADDTAQETFVRIYHGLKGFRMESKFSTWAWRIAVNACKNKLDSKAWKERRAKADLEAKGVNVLGPTNHDDFLLSIYFFDPSGHRLELSVQTSTAEMDAAFEAEALNVLELWDKTHDWSQRQTSHP